MSHRLTPSTCLLLAATLSGCASMTAPSATGAQGSTAKPAVLAAPSPSTPPRPSAVAAVVAAAASAVAADAGSPELRPYDKLITTDARTQDGLFKLHTIKNKLYFEIPKALLDKPLLMVATATAVPASVDHVGRALHQEVVRFSLKNNRVYLQSISHAFVSDPSRPIAPAVQGSQRDAILTALQVESYGKDGAPVIEVSRLFLSEVGDFSARTALRATGLDSNRSYIERSKAFPASLRIDAVHTYGFASAPVLPGMPAMPTQPPRSGSVDVAYNIVQLPETPMRPRLMDDRVGFFGLSRLDFGTAEHGSKRERLISRWRLEKKDPAAPMSEPVKPIVWYIDKATPAWLVPHVKKGVEAWNVAFEAAGFKNAVQARSYPSKDEDPEFDPDDVRYSVIRWVPSAIANAYGPHLNDPRSGEILNANVVIYHNIMQLQRDWYVTQAGAADRRAQVLPLPDDLMGALVGYVVTHEVGHSLGFPHNMKASSLYPVDKLRDAEWLRTMGHVPSIMDYSRFNYLVQPEDKIDPALLIPRVGPYDIFATRWGYTPIPTADTPEAELPTLNAWLREQDDKPWLRFNTPRPVSDFGETAEAVGDADAVTATTLGLKNLRRIVKQLPAMAIKRGQDDRTLEELYAASWSQWTNELGHVLAIVGGYDSRNKHGDQAGATSSPVPRVQQVRAVKLLSEQLLSTPTWLLEPAVTERLRPFEWESRLLQVQRNMLRGLLNPGRTARLQAQEAAQGAARAYRVDQLLADLRSAIFNAPAVGSSLLQRNLQRAYLDVLIERLGSTQDPAKAVLRAELKTLKPLFAARAATGDRLARAHWDELFDTTQRALDPRAASAAAPAGLTVVLRPGFAEAEATDFCWPAHQHP